MLFGWFVECVCGVVLGFVGLFWGFFTWLPGLLGTSERLGASERLVIVWVFLFLFVVACGLYFAVVLGVGCWFGFGFCFVTGSV